MKDALINQLEAEINENPTSILYKDAEVNALKGTSSETRSLAKAGLIAFDSFNLWMLPQNDKPVAGEFIYINEIKYKITGVEDLLYESGYNLQIERAL